MIRYYKWRTPAPFADMNARQAGRSGSPGTRPSSLFLRSWGRKTVWSGQRTGHICGNMSGSFSSLCPVLFQNHVSIRGAFCSRGAQTANVPPYLYKKIPFYPKSPQMKKLKMTSATISSARFSVCSRRSSACRFSIDCWISSIFSKNSPAKKQ